MPLQENPRLEEALKQARSYRAIPEPKRNGFQSDIIALADGVELLKSNNAQLVSETQGKQSRIDALMLEYCPDEMSEEQKAEWARHQEPVRFGCHCDIEAMPEGFEPDDCVMDKNRDEDCVYAGKLRREGKTKIECAHWRPIKMSPRLAAALAPSAEEPSSGAKVAELAELVRRLSRFAPPGPAAEAIKYLQRHNLEGSSPEGAKAVGE